MQTRREFLSLLGLGGTAWALGCRPRSPSPLARGIAWLWERQDDAGAIPSTTYGFFALGQSTTALALRAILDAPVALHDEERIGRALTWMLETRDDAGALGRAGDALDYPVYATSLMLSCLALAQPPGWQAAARPSVAWLREQQLRTTAGWAGHPAQGGFTMGGAVRPEPPHAGHVDLSMTRQAVVALRSLGVGPDDPTLREARAFVSRCRTPDGGFLYSPVQEAVNKGGRQGNTLMGYGSATADGLLALHALGVSAEDPVVQEALAYLHRIHRTDANPGVGDGPHAAFGEAMKGYYRAAAASVFSLLGGPPGWKAALEEAITAEQREDGSWIGTSPLQKEDDPILATSLAVAALTRTR